MHSSDNNINNDNKMMIMPINTEVRMKHPSSRVNKYRTKRVAEDIGNIDTLSDTAIQDAHQEYNKRATDERRCLEMYGHLDEERGYERPTPREDIDIETFIQKAENNKVDELQGKVIYTEMSTYHQQKLAERMVVRELVDPLAKERREKAKLAMRVYRENNRDKMNLANIKHQKKWRAKEDVKEKKFYKKYGDKATANSTEDKATLVPYKVIVAQELALCPCNGGKMLRRDGLALHIKGKKHIQYEHDHPEIYRQMVTDRNCKCGYPMQYEVFSHQCSGQTTKIEKEERFCIKCTPMDPFAGVINGEKKIKKNVEAITLPPIDFGSDDDDSSSESSDEECCNCWENADDGCKCKCHPQCFECSECNKELEMTELQQEEPDLTDCGQLICTECWVEKDREYQAEKKAEEENQARMKLILEQEQASIKKVVIIKKKKIQKLPPAKLFIVEDSSDDEEEIIITPKPKVIIIKKKVAKPIA
jgi:hypothetical protein